MLSLPCYELCFIGVETIIQLKIVQSNKQQLSNVERSTYVFQNVFDTVIWNILKFSFELKYGNFVLPGENWNFPGDSFQL